MMNLSKMKHCCGNSLGCCCTTKNGTTVQNLLFYLPMMMMIIFVCNNNNNPTRFVVVQSFNVFPPLVSLYQNHPNQRFNNNNNNNNNNQNHEQQSNYPRNSIISRIGNHHRFVDKTSRTRTTLSLQRKASCSTPSNSLSSFLSSTRTPSSSSLSLSTTDIETLCDKLNTALEMNYKEMTRATTPSCKVQVKPVPTVREEDDMKPKNRLGLFATQSIGKGETCFAVAYSDIYELRADLVRDTIFQKYFIQWE